MVYSKRIKIFAVRKTNDKKTGRVSVSFLFSTRHSLFFVKYLPNKSNCAKGIEKIVCTLYAGALAFNSLLFTLSFQNNKN